MYKTISIVTGTGRSGTSLLMKLLSFMGHTELKGFFNESVRGGYETVLDSEEAFNIFNLPRIIKDPRLLVSCETVLEKYPKLKIDHAFLCVRDFDTAAKSRSESNIFFSEWKGMAETYGENSHKQQIVFFQRAVGKFIETCAKMDIDVTILSYPRFAIDSEYLFEKLNKSPFKSELDLIEHYIDLIVDKSLIRHTI
tara:strand:- start:32 stop:619 length:588 start_codon:yes stop_codon:yes gene_type:complete